MCRTEHFQKTFYTCFVFYSARNSNQSISEIFHDLKQLPKILTKMLQNIARQIARGLNIGSGYTHTKHLQQVPTLLHVKYLLDKPWSYKPRAADDR